MTRSTQICALAILFCVTGWSQGRRAVFGPAVAIAVCDDAAAASGEYLRHVCLEPGTGEFILRYPANLAGIQGQEGEMIEERIELRNLGDPTVAVDVSRLSGDGGFRYAYALENGPRARRPITVFKIVVARDDDTAELQHPSWRGSVANIANPMAVIAPQAALLGGPELRRSANLGRFGSWMTTVGEHPVPAGGRQINFVATSKFRPGWTTAYIGAGKGIQLRHSVPTKAIGKELEILHRPENYYSTALTVGPKFGPDVSAQWIAADWNLGIQKLVREGKLNAESAYVQETLHALVQLAQAEAPFEPTIRAKPSTETESLIDKALRWALAPPAGR